MDRLDDIDRAILEALQRDGRMSITDLAQKVELTPPTVQRRVKLLEEAGYIKGYTAILDPLRVNLPVTAFIFIESVAGCELEEVGQNLCKISGVQELHNLIGEWCFLLKVRATSPQSLEDILHRQIRHTHGVRRTLTILATSSPFETPNVPIPERE